MTLSIDGLIVLNSGILSVTAVSAPTPQAPFTLEYNLATPNSVVTLPLSGTVNCTVNWGDGSSDVYTTIGNKTHTYTTSGIKTVTITGTLTGFGAFSVSQSRLTRVLDFGNTGLTSLAYAFTNASLLTDVPSNLPSSVTNIAGIFTQCSILNSSNISSWNTSNVTNVSTAFQYATAFNQNLGNWDVSAVTEMEYMFYFAQNFNNGESSSINNWNTSAVTTMRFMFYAAAKFNQPIGNWDTSAVTNMNFMFGFARAFNQNINSWNVSNVTSMGGVFNSAWNFNQPLNNWDTSSVISMFYMFSDARAFNQPIGNWNTSSVSSMQNMFTAATEFNQPIGNWNVSSVWNMFAMFNDASNFDQNLNAWNTPLITPIPESFSTNSPLQPNNYPLSWQSALPYFSMTIDASLVDPEEPSITLNSINLYVSGQGTIYWGDGTTSQTTGSQYYAHTYTNPTTYTIYIVGSNIFTIENFYTNSIISVNNFGNLPFLSKCTFQYSVYLTSVPNTLPSTITDCSNMFTNCIALNDAAISNWDTSNVQGMSAMFLRAESFNQSLSSWNTANVFNMQSMFAYAIDFNQPIGSWNVSNVINMDAMFFDANNFNQDLSGWCVSLIPEEPSSFAGNSALSPSNYPVWGTCPPPPSSDMILVLTVNTDDPNNFIDTFTFYLSSPVGISTINWGDGFTETVSDTSDQLLTHTYSTTGSYTVTISGPVTRFNTMPNQTLTHVNSWGNLPSLTEVGFYSSQNLVSVPPTLPTNITSLTSMFNFCTSFNDSNVTTWNTTNITNMDYVFYTATSFNQNISSWNTQNVTSMGGMFSHATVFNQPIGNWNVSNVTNMNSMFYNAHSFAQDLTSWCVINVNEYSNFVNPDFPPFNWNPALYPQWGTCP